jgi:hypothetical protein
MKPILSDLGLNLVFKYYRRRASRRLAQWWASLTPTRVRPGS